MKKVALSGAGGNMGRLLRVELQQRGVNLRSAGGRTPLVPLQEGEDVMHGDLRDPAVVDRLLHGVDVLIHLAGTSVEKPLPEIIENNLVALHQVYEGARRNKVQRIVFASSNHAFGMHSVNDKLDLDAPFRPDGFYGLSKAWGELMARMYWDKHGIEGISLRIGSCEKAPANFRHLSTWLGHEDTVELIMRCIDTPDVGYVALWGVSDNARSYWTPNASERLGYQPQQNSQDYAPVILPQKNPLNAVEQQFQGGSFVTIDFTPLAARPSASKTAVL